MPFAAALRGGIDNVNSFRKGANVRKIGNNINCNFAFDPEDAVSFTAIRS